MILVDANILLRLIQIGHPHQQVALDSIALLKGRDREEFSICPQVLYEMYAVCTRPAASPYPGLGLTPAAAMAQLAAAEHQFTLDEEPSSVLPRWKELVVRHSVLGKSAHDARLAALMIERSIARLLTFNDSHFARYTEVAPLNPFDVLGIPPVKRESQFIIRSDGGPSESAIQKKRPRRPRRH